MNLSRSVARLALLLGFWCAFNTARALPPPTDARLAALKKAAAHGEAEAQFQLGLLARENKDYSEGREEAKIWYLKAAKQGHARAQYELGRAYVEAISDECDRPLAEKWLTKAAAQGCGEAWVALGNLYAEGSALVVQDLPRARDCYRKAAAIGGREVCYELGEVYRRGHGGIAADWPKALEFYRRAAEQGHPEAQYTLGQLYQYGIGTAVDLAKAAHWYTQAGKQEHYWAEEKLGWFYEQGLAVAKNREQAIAWYKRSQKHGGYCRRGLLRLGDPEERDRPPNPADLPPPVTKDVEITLEPEKRDYDLDDLVIIGVHYRNVSKEAYTFWDGRAEPFKSVFDVKDERGNRLPNPYEHNGLIIHCGFCGSSGHDLVPGGTEVLRRTLNQCVRFPKPGTYTITTEDRVCRTKAGVAGVPNTNFIVKAKPITLKIRAADPRKRHKDIARLLRAYTQGEMFPEGMMEPAENFGDSTNILRRLAFYTEPTLLPIFVDFLTKEQDGSIAEDALRALPDRKAVLWELEQRLEHPELYDTLELLHSYVRLAGLDDYDFEGDFDRLDNWKREQEIYRKVREKALKLLHSDKDYRYAYLVPGLIGNNDDLFLIDYLILSRPSAELLSRCEWAMRKVNLGREHMPFLEKLLDAERGVRARDAAILQLVRLDRAKYLPWLQANREDFSEKLLKMLLEPADD